MKYITIYGQASDKLICREAIDNQVAEHKIYNHGNGQPLTYTITEPDGSGLQVTGFYNPHPDIPTRWLIGAALIQGKKPVSWQATTYPKTKNSVSRIVIPCPEYVTVQGYPHTREPKPVPKNAPENTPNRMISLWNAVLAINEEMLQRGGGSFKVQAPLNAMGNKLSTWISDQQHGPYDTQTETNTIEEAIINYAHQFK